MRGYEGEESEEEGGMAAEHAGPSLPPGYGRPPGAWEIATQNLPGLISKLFMLMFIKTNRVLYSNMC